MVDGAIAAGVLLMMVAVSLPDEPLTAAASAAMTIPFAWRRSRPVLAGTLSLGAAFVLWLVVTSGGGGTPVEGALVPFVVYSVTAYGPRWAGHAALAAGLIGAVLSGATSVGDGLLNHVVIGSALASTVLPGWALGRLRSVRRERVEALAERNRLLEVERDQQALLAVSAERTRIAREMHDVVAHSMAVMIAQADGGRYAAADSPDAAAAALDTIAVTGRRAMTDMRRLLGVLRQGTEPADGADRLPQPGLAELDDLIEQMRAGGLAVAWEPVARGPELGPGLELVIYRIVQEGLTNVIKHAGPGARAEVSLDWGNGRVRLEVRDDGRGLAATATGGHGLTGLRERAAVFGGTVVTGARPGGGHLLRAELPVAP